MNWIYPNGIACVAVPTRNGIAAVGFVYLITIDGMEYIGKKNYYTTRKKPFGKKELSQVTDKRKKKYHKITKESNWLSYCSSSDSVKKLVGEGCVPERKILRVCYSLKEMSFFENKFLYEVFGKENVLNENLSGTYYVDEVRGYYAR